MFTGDAQATGHGPLESAMGRTNTEPTIRCFPPEDRAFAAFVQRAATDLLAAGIPARDAPAALERRLRATFPRATVRPRDSLADIGVPGPTWYAYRSGRFDARSDHDSWWTDASLPRIQSDATGRHLWANDAALDLLCISLDAFRSSRVGDFSPPDAAAHARAVPSYVNGVALDSEIVLVTGDGRRLHVEFHVTRDPQTDHLEAVLRPVPGPQEPEGAESSTAE